jgi:hypothetical protein
MLLSEVFPLESVFILIQFSPTTRSYINETTAAMLPLSAKEAAFIFYSYPSYSY